MIMNRTAVVEQLKATQETLAKLLALLDTRSAQSGGAMATHACHTGAGE